MAANLPRIFGFLTISLGLELIVGWMVHNEAMVRILSSSNSVSLNTAIGFVFAGAALMLGKSPHSVRLRRIIAVILMLVFACILFEDIFDISLGLDWPSLHRQVLDGSPRPGRVAPNTCVGFILLGLELFVFDSKCNAALRMLAGISTASNLFIIGTGVTGLMLDPTLMFGWYKFNRMAAPTAFGLFLLVIGTYWGFLDNASSTQLSTRRQGNSILLKGSLILLAMGLTGALTTFIIFANYQQEIIRFRLNSEMLRQTRFAATEISRANETTRRLVQLPFFISQLAKIDTRSSSANHAQFQNTLTRLLEQGFTSMQFHWSNGLPPTVSGHKADMVSLAIPLAEPENGVLFMAQGRYFYRASAHLILDSGKDIGVLTTERPIDSLLNIYVEDKSLRSAEVVLCGVEMKTISCFPSRLHAGVLRLKSESEREHLAVDDALAGRSGIHTTSDYRGKPVVAAFSPVGKTGLAVISKADTADIYAPINFLLSRSLLVLGIALAIGVVLLRRMVSPIVQSIVRAEEVARESEQRAMTSQQRLKTITDNVPALIAFIDKNMVYQFANAMYERWFDVPSRDVIGKTPKDLLSADSYEKSLPRIRRALAGESSELTYKTESERPSYPKYVSVTYLPEKTEAGEVNGFTVLAFDATERSEHEAALSHLAYHDGLTGLPNRRMFNEQLKLALLRSRRQKTGVALLYLDIDHFKSINDTKGHETGDFLLIEFAKRLRETVRVIDTVSRLGGDEFTVILENLLDIDQAEMIANKILKIARMPFFVDTQELRVTTSIGIAYSIGRDVLPEEMVREGDDALYRAKERGRDCSAIA